MNKFFQRLFNITGDSTVQVIDLILFLGYFSVCLFAGGVAYETSYNNSFNLPIKSNVGDIRVAIIFVTNVLLMHWYWLPASLYILFFIFIFYACRYVWKPWFGYFLLSLLLYFTFLSCGLIGKVVGNKDAKNDKFKETTSKPIIKLSGEFSHIGSHIDLKSGDYHLLLEDNNWFFVFEPQVDSPIIEVIAIPKNKVFYYEVTIK